MNDAIPKYENLLPIDCWQDVILIRQLLMRPEWLTGSPIHAISEYYAHDHNLLLRQGHIMTAPQVWLCAPNWALSITSNVLKENWQPYNSLKTLRWNGAMFSRNLTPLEYQNWMHVYDVTATYQGPWQAIKGFFMYIQLAQQLPPV